jgi:hypothetical protein
MASVMGGAAGSGQRQASSQGEPGSSNRQTKNSSIVSHAQPKLDSRLDTCKQLGAKSTYVSNQPSKRHRDQTLCIEGAGLEKPECRGDLESGAANACGVRHDRHERAIRVLNRNADDQTRPNFGGKAEIDQPYLSTRR